jgi:hypothetical protein
MVGKKRKHLEIATYSYAVVETSLATIFGASPDIQRGAFRARLKHFQRLGLPGIESGKGTRVDYTFPLACQWLIGLMMAEVGVDPIIIVQVVKTRWEFLEMWIGRAVDPSEAENPVFLTLRPRLMSGAWIGGKSDPATLEWIGAFRRYDYRHLKDRDGRPIQRENIAMMLDQEEDWLCVRNLTEALTRLQSTLQRQ